MHTAPGPAGNRNDQGKLWPRDIRWNFEFCIKTEENLLLTAGRDHGIIRNCGGRGILPFYPMKRPRRRGRGGAPKAGSRVVGAKQTRRALKDGRAKRVYMAKDADPRLLQPLVQEAVRQRVPLIQVDTMRQLGEACGISVGAAIVAAV